MFTTSLTANDLLFLLQGAWTTLAITAMAMLIGTLLGVVFGLLRALLPRASLPLAALLDVFRSVPLLIQFVLLNSFKSILGLDWSAFAVACLVLGVRRRLPHRGGPRRRLGTAERAPGGAFAGPELSPGPVPHRPADGRPRPSPAGST